VGVTVNSQSTRALSVLSIRLPLLVTTLRNPRGWYLLTVEKCPHLESSVILTSPWESPVERRFRIQIGNRSGAFTRGVGPANRVLWKNGLPLTTCQSVIHVPQIDASRWPPIGVVHACLKAHHDTFCGDVPPATDQRQR
jgi:hypothetical protein